VGSNPKLNQRYDFLRCSKKNRGEGDYGGTEPFLEKKPFIIKFVAFTRRIEYNFAMQSSPCRLE
jgi:hypothetical protein